MRGIQSLALGSALLSACSEGLILKKRDEGRTRAIGMDIERRTIDPLERHRNRLLKRTGTVQAALDNKVREHFLILIG